MSMRSLFDDLVKRARLVVPPAAAAPALRLRRALPVTLVDSVERRAGLAPDFDHWPTPPPTPVRLLVGPAGYAGQGHAWARAAERNPGVGACNFVVNNPLGFPVDLTVPQRAFSSSAWARGMEEHVIRDFTHVLIEGGLPILGLRHGADAAGDVAVLDRAGLAMAFVAHGTDVRDLDDHARRFPWSPYAAPGQWRSLGRFASRNRALLTDLMHRGHEVFVSTPDLLADLPGAAWLPVVVDPAVWTNVEPILHDGRRPVVVHAPTVSTVKGTAAAEPQLHMLHDEGVIEYRRLRGLPRAQFREAVRTADVVIDQFGLGSYGVAAVEAMAAGRLTVGRVDPVRKTVQDLTGMRLPILEAAPEELGAILRSALAVPDHARSLASEGAIFARKVHDGARSAAVLAPFLGARGGA